MRFSILETILFVKLPFTGQTLAAQLSDCLNKLLATYKDQQTLIINSLVEGNSRYILLIKLKCNKFLYKILIYLFQCVKICL